LAPRRAVGSVRSAGPAESPPEESSESAVWSWRACDARGWRRHVCQCSGMVACRQAATGQALARRLVP
jgi:hypothetical protein